MKLKLNSNEALAALAIGVLILAAFLVYSQALPAHAGIGGSPNVISVATTSAAFSITSSARILATTTNALGNGTGYTRIYATICNPNATVVALNLNADAPANKPIGQVTTYIAAAAGYSACYEITDKNQYSGSVSASSTNQTATAITVQEYSQ